MKADASLPGARRLGYALLCWVNRRPLIWRGIGALWRRFPSLTGRVRPTFAARHQAVKSLLLRSDSFQSTSHRPNLVAGDFLIAMPPGQQYRNDRQRFLGVIPDAVAAGVRCDLRVRRVVASLSRRPDFDLIEDYLMGIVYHGVIGGLGDAAVTVVSGRRHAFPDRALQRQYLLEVRHVAAQLFSGADAPADVQARAHACAASLRRRIDEAILPLRAGSGFAAFVDRDSIARNGIGYAWVSHPVTVQSGALLFVELMKRRKQYAALHEQASSLGPAVWTDKDFRKLVKGHVLELMRFRPVFPVIGRDVPRATHLDAGGGRCPLRPAGSSVAALVISALFDSEMVSDPRTYSVSRKCVHEDELMMMFGYGEHQCPGRWLAVEVLTSALIGLLTMPRLRLSRPRRLRHDGPMIAEMRLTRAGP